jgi:hypothetical protein
VESEDRRGGVRGEESRRDILFVGLVSDVAERNMEGSGREGCGFRCIYGGGSGCLGHGRVVRMLIFCHQGLEVL